MKWLRRGSVFALFTLLFLPMFAVSGEQAKPGAAPPPAEEKWLVDRSLTLTPQPEAKPALAYRLFPLASDRKEGNAVPIYLRLNFEQNDARRRDWSETPTKWNDMPLDKIPLAEARTFLKGYRNFLRQFELGARRKTAEWNYTLDQGSTIDILLPDAQTMRSFAPMMVLKVRVALAEGDYETAAHWLETGFAFSQHVANGPFLINRLVGLACANQFAGCLFDFVEQADAPNMYWSLTALPRPMIDLREAMEYEYRFIDMQFPDLADLDRPRSPEQWDAVLKKVRTEVQRISAVGGEPGDSKVKPPAAAGPEDPASKSSDLPAARKYLAEHMKLPADKVEAMPPAQVVLLYMRALSDEYRDDAYKAFYLAYPEAARVFAESETRRKAAPDTEGKRFADLWLPAIGKVEGAQVRLERKIAALRVIEALRLHAAAHDGALLDKLSDVTLVPIPDDPGTGKPFEYQRDGETATLASRIAGEKLADTGLRYRLTMKKK